MCKYNIKFAIQKFVKLAKYLYTCSALKDGDISTVSVI